jgi:hypothetical protein
MRAWGHSVVEGVLALGSEKGTEKGTGSFSDEVRKGRVHSLISGSSVSRFR